MLSQIRVNKVYWYKGQRVLVVSVKEFPAMGRVVTYMDEDSNPQKVRYPEFKREAEEVELPSTSGTLVNGDNIITFNSLGNRVTVIDNSNGDQYVSNFTSTQWARQVKKLLATGWKVKD
jgi:hypothetical protein